jgi:hypothetical protein
MNMKWMCVLTIAASGLVAQEGNDINSAIPIWFGQTVTDVVDGSVRPLQVYSIALARGQKLTATVRITSGAACFTLNMYGPAKRTLEGSGFNADKLREGYQCRNTASTWDYEVAAAGTYFIAIKPNADWSGVKYELQVTAQGTPLLTALPTKAGCVFGQVDSIVFSLRLLAMNLPDEVVIGGVVLCPTCDVKPPLYSQMVDKLETAMKSGVNVEACHDSQGQLFQIKLQR